MFSDYWLKSRPTSVRVAIDVKLTIADGEGDEAVASGVGCAANIIPPPMRSDALQSSIGSGGAGGATNWLGCLVAQTLYHCSPAIVSTFSLVGLKAVSTGSSN